MTVTEVTLEGLAASAWLGRQPVALRDALVGRGRRTALEPGQWLHGEGDEATGVFVVLSGVVRVLTTVEDGRTVLLDLLGPGAALGQSISFGGGPRLVSAIAATPVAVLRISDIGLQAAARVEPEVWRAVSELVYGQLAHVVRLAGEALSLGPRARLAARLVALSRTFAAHDDGWIPVSQADLAELTALSRKSVNQHLGAWRSAGLLELRYGAIRLRAPERLSQGRIGD